MVRNQKRKGKTDMMKANASTVKEVRVQIENLQRNYDDMIKLQDYFLGLTPGFKEDDVEPIRTLLEDEIISGQSIRMLCTEVAEILAGEIERLNNLIDNAVVNIE